MKKLQINADRQGYDVRWIPPELRHVTLVFLGNRSPAERAHIEEACRDVARLTAGFSLRVEGLDAFPEPRRARVLVFQVQSSRHVRALRSALCERLGEDPDGEREFQPHLTVARLRNAQSVTDLVSPFRHASADKLRVSEIVLFESILKTPFPVYKVLERFQLTGVEPAPEDSDI